MNFAVFQALGDRVEAEYRRLNYDDKVFPQIAESALTDWQECPEFNLGEVADFLLTTSVKQQPELEFSNLPVTFYRSREFYIECLIWVDATTSIHQHAFSGAFRVVTGSSLHSEYEFVEQARVSQLLLLGEVRTQRLEALTRGDVRRITSGRGGLVHSLFHLDQPSVTLVIRTYGEPWAQPQYDVYPPTIAAATQILAEDSRVRLAKRLINVLGQLSPADAIEVWCRGVAQLDFPRVFVICLELAEQLGRPEIREPVLTAIRKQHGSLAENLDGCLAERSRIESLNSCRASITEPELRFFIALLLNATSRRELFKVLHDRYPRTPPEERCATFLAELGDPKALLMAAHSADARRTWAAAPSHFGLEMVRAKRSVPEEATTEVFHAIAAGLSDRQLRAGLESKCSSAVVEKAIAAYRQYQSLPELRVFAIE
jgi:hypothetical protein